MEKNCTTITGLKLPTVLSWTTERYFSAFKYLNERQYFLNSFSYKINYSVSFWYNILYIYQGCQTNVFTRALFFRLKLMEDRHKKPSVLRPDVENTKNVEAGFLKL